MYVIVNTKGEVETEIDTDSLDVVQAAVDRVYPKHTPIFSTVDESMVGEETRLENPVPITPELAMARSGLPWRPNAKRPGGGNLRGVGITMDEVLARYPLGKQGLDRAWEDLLPYFPNTPGQNGYDQWASSSASMARHLLKSNAKTEKAVQGVSGWVPPSYAVGINLLPASWGKKLSERDPALAAKSYYEQKGASEMPILFGLPGDPPLAAARRLQLVADGPSGVDRRMSTLCVGSSKECRDSCLVFTGQNSAVAYNDFSKMFVTRAFFFQPLAFARMVMEAIDKHVLRCRRGISFQKGAPPVKVAPYVRLNVYSDIPWELFFPELFDYCAKVYPDLSLYDYTKVPGRGALPKPNYDLTFSYSGKNLDECKKALRSGMRIAVVFLRRTAKGSKVPDPETGIVSYKPAEPVTDITFLSRKTPAGVFEGWPVIDGDTYDMRPRDPASVVVGLRYKIPQKLEVEQTIVLRNGTTLKGKVTGKTPDDLISIRVAGKSERIDPGQILSIGQSFVLVPPSQKAKFLVKARTYKNQWVFGVTPHQTNTDLESDINEGQAAELPTMIQLKAIPIPAGPLESVALCTVFSAAGGPSCLTGPEAGSTRYFESSAGGATLYYPLTDVPPDESFAIMNALLGLVPIDGSVDTTDGTWQTITQMEASREFEASYAKDASAPGAAIGMLALRAFAVLAGQRIQQIADALSLSWSAAYSKLTGQGFAPPDGWLELIAPEPQRWFATDDHHGNVSDVGLAYTIGLHGLQMVEAQPGVFLGMSVSGATPVFSFTEEDWEIALVQTDLNGMTVHNPLGAIDMTWPFQGDTYTFTVYRSSDLWSLARSGLPAVGAVLTQAFASLATAWVAVAPASLNPMFAFDPNLFGGIKVTPGGIPWPPVGIDVTGFTPQEGDACTTDAGRPGKLDASLHCASAMRIDPGYGVPPGATPPVGPTGGSGGAPPSSPPKVAPKGHVTPQQAEGGTPDAPAASSSPWLWFAGGLALTALVGGGWYFATRKPIHVPEVPKHLQKRAGNPVATMTVAEAMRDKEKARTFWKALSRQDKFTLGDGLVLGDIDWMDWGFEKRPSSAFRNEVDYQRQLWESDPR
jgi:hypothetical protein